MQIFKVHKYYFYENALNQLSEREKEIRVKELKITKGIREKEIAKELKRLEAEDKWKRLFYL